MKKLILLLAVFTACVFSANAQLSKSLKNAGKSVGGAVGSAAGEMSANIAANKVAVKMVSFMDANNKALDASSDYTKRLASLVEKNYVTVDDLSLNYMVYESAEVNILACADGSIRVYSAMMDSLTDKELVAVIANQIGHIANKDVRNALMKMATGNNASNATAAQLEKMLSFSGDKLGSVANELIQIPYTNEQSQAADKYAVELLKKNNINADVLITALQKFAVMEANDKKAETDENTLISPASKYIKVNASNADRAALLK